MPKPYDKTTHDGKTVDWLTKAALMVCEDRLGYPLTVVQGSYHKGVSASAGTHDGGGVIDLAPWDWENKVRVLRSVGFAVWHRPKLPGVWNEHIHAVLIGNKKLAPVAARQVTSYRQHRDGLAANGRDTTWHPSVIPTFHWIEPLRVDGVDLSHHNVIPDNAFTEGKKAGVRFVYHKATEGVGYADAMYETRRAMAKKAGLPFGAYHFARPATSSGTDQAKAFLAVAKPAPGDMRVMLDVEDRGTLSQGLLTAWVGEFVAEIRKATGARPLIYTPFDLNDKFYCALWAARYSPANTPPVIPKPWSKARVRQFANGVTGFPRWVPGFGHVDLNTIGDDSLDWYLLPPTNSLRAKFAASDLPWNNG